MDMRMDVGMGMGRGMGSIHMRCYCSPPLCSGWRRLEHLLSSIDARDVDLHRTRTLAYAIILRPPRPLAPVF